MLTQQQIIDLVLSAKHWQEVFPKKSTYKDLYRDYSKAIYPDFCKLEKAQDAFSKLSILKKQIDDSYSFKDDSGGILKYTDNSIEIEGDKSLLKQSLENYLKINKTKISLYLADDIEFKDGILKFFSKKRIISIKDLIISEEHFRWILNRMLAFSAYLEDLGYVNIGINPESIFIKPDDHGLLCSSFYHLRLRGQKVYTYSSKYKSWYHPQMFTKKLAEPYIDTELSK